MVDTDQELRSKIKISDIKDSHVEIKTVRQANTVPVSYFIGVIVVLLMVGGILFLQGEVKTTNRNIHIEQGNDGIVKIGNGDVHKTINHGIPK